jgi:hypothetical protein
MEFSFFGLGPAELILGAVCLAGAIAGVVVLVVMQTRGRDHDGE